MFSFGVFLLVLSLLYFATALLSGFFLQKLNNNEKYKKIQSVLVWMQQDEVKTTSGYIGFLIALWNFFAPDFGDSYGGFTLIGALVPSVVLFLDSVILNPKLRDWIPFLHKFQDKFDQVMNTVSPIAGWLTLVIAIVHAVAYRIPFL